MKKNQKKKIKKKTNDYIIKFKLNEIKIENIIENENYIPITYNDDKTYVKTTYVFKYKSPNFTFYICNQRQNCNGSAKIDLKNKEFIITKGCNRNIKHNQINYEEFIDLLKSKQYNK